MTFSELADIKLSLHPAQPLFLNGLSTSQTELVVKIYLCSILQILMVPAWTTWYSLFMGGPVWRDRVVLWWLSAA